MEKLILNTEFAPAECEGKRITELQSKAVVQNQLLIIIANSVSEMLVVLNNKRQIIYANEIFNSKIGQPNSTLCIGKRVGEALDCINADKSAGGCGTTEFCRTCGAVNAFLEAQIKNKSEKECRILKSDNDALDLRVKATLFNSDNEIFTIFSLSDISSDKRKQTLERIFFHDVLNSAGGISGLSGIMPEIKDPVELIKVAELINKASDNLINEIQAQRNLVAAENDYLEVKYNEIESFKILKDLADLYSKHEIAVNKYISINKKSENIIVETDAVLLRRIIGNMIKNALEASLPASIVTISSNRVNETVRFSVHNKFYMPREVQMQLFQRSFSTKGIGRGVGTYSMKLLGEKYLKGKVDFESSVQNGTTFFIEI